MTRTPDDVKKGLEYISIKDVARKLDAWEDGIPYDYVEDAAADALALIQQLESDKQQLEGLLTHMNQLRDAAAGRALKMEERVQQLEAERDAAVKDIKQMVQAPYEPAYCEYCKKTEEECAKVNCWRRDQFEWRGVQKEE